MGMLYEFRCSRCNPRIPPEEMDERQRFELEFHDMGTPLGCGLGYPYVCKGIYQDMGQGKYGPEARKTVKRMFRPGIYHSRDVHVCEKCENWKIADNIKICRRKSLLPEWGSALDREREAAAGPRLKPLCFLDVKEWEVVWDLAHSCDRCGGRMIPRRDPKNLKCRTCGGPIEVRVVGHWD